MFDGVGPSALSNGLIGSWTWVGASGLRSAVGPHRTPDTLGSHQIEADFAQLSSWRSKAGHSQMKRLAEMRPVR